MPRRPPSVLEVVSEGILKLQHNNKGCQDRQGIDMSSAYIYSKVHTLKDSLASLECILH